MLRMVLLIIQLTSIFVLTYGCMFLFTHWKNKANSYLFLYCLATLVNNLGYLIEMSAVNSESALKGTQMAYLGKVFLPVTFFMIICNLCKVKLPFAVTISMFLFHAFTLITVLSCRYNNLFYTSITYTEEGLFAHNIYGHGVLYNLYMLLMGFYYIAVVVIVVRALLKDKSKEFWLQALCFLGSVTASLLGLLIFLTGKTGGYDTTNISYLISAILVSLAVYKFNLLDALDLVKDYAIDNLADGIIAVDEAGSVVYYNEPMSRIYPNLEEKKQEIVGHIEELIEEKENIYRDNTIYKPTVKPLFQKNIHRGNMYVLSDRTESMTYTLELKRQKEIAEDANNSKSAFLSNMSHEIRTPMNAIVGMTEILLRKDCDEETKAYLNNIRSSGDALLSIINDILDFSKIESGKMEIVNDDYDLRQLIKELDVVFKTRIQNKPIKMIYDIDKEIPVALNGDEKRIRQVLINLVNNAIKFTEEGYVRVSIKQESLEDGISLLTFAVQDTGQGIKKEDMGKLFGSYQQVDTKKNHKKEGTGLGLAICKQLIRLMGGSIQVESVYGEGSKFFFTIPQKALDHAIVKEEESIDSFIAPNANILVVDDSDMNLKVFKGLFAPLQMKIDTAENGREALELVKVKNYDIIFMDHMMPIMDGIECTNAIRNLCTDYNHPDTYYKSIPIIALSANATEEAKQLFLSSNMNGFASKPIKTKQVYAILKKYLPEDKVIWITEETVGTASSKEPEVTSDISENVAVKNNGIDITIGIENCGSEELYYSLVKDYYKLIDAKSELINKCIETDDLKTYTIEVHALKSASRMIGASELGEDFLHLENLGNANDKESIVNDTPQVLLKYNDLKAVIENMIDLDDSESEKISADMDAIKDALRQMKKAVDNFDLDGIDEAMKVLDGFIIPEEIKEKIDQLTAFVADVNMDEIVRVIDEII